MNVKRLEWLARVHLPELGHDDVVLARVELDAHRLAQDDWRGEFSLGEATHSVIATTEKTFLDRHSDSPS